jgi:hypothetical protein
MKVIENGTYDASEEVSSNVLLLPDDGDNNLVDLKNGLEFIVSILNEEH